MAMFDDFFQKSTRGWQACHAERNHQLPLQSEWPKQLKLRLSSPKHLSSHVWLELERARVEEESKGMVVEVPLSFQT